MKKLLIASLLLTACGTKTVTGAPGSQGEPGPKGSQGETVINEVPAAEPPQTEVGDLVYYENKYRGFLGQAPLVNGLSCALYTVPNTTTQITGATLTSVGSFHYVGEFNVADSSVSTGMPVLPDALKSVYKTWYLLRCTGYIVITDDGFHSFDLTSDDGAELYISGTKIIDNDGLHGATTLSGTKLIKRGVTAFRLDYLQAAGNQALIVKMDGAVLPTELFYK